jgi:hypothetical protein
MLSGGQYNGGYKKYLHMKISQLVPMLSRLPMYVYKLLIAA